MNSTSSFLRHSYKAPYPASECQHTSRQNAPYYHNVRSSLILFLTCLPSSSMTSISTAQPYLRISRAVP